MTVLSQGALVRPLLLAWGQKERTVAVKSDLLMSKNRIFRFPACRPWAEGRSLRAGTNVLGQLRIGSGNLDISHLHDLVAWVVALPSRCSFLNKQVPRVPRLAGRLLGRLLGCHGNYLGGHLASPVEPS